MKTIASKKIYKGNVIDLIIDLLKAGKNKYIKREIVKHNGSVVILPVLSSDKVIMIEQYRYPVHKKIWELPAGTLKKGEEPLACAKRELEEETGYIAGSLRKIHSFYSAPGFCTEKMHLFFASDLKKNRQKLEEDEKITTQCMPIKNIMKMIIDGKIIDAKTLVGILFFMFMQKDIALNQKSCIK